MMGGPTTLWLFGSRGHSSPWNHKNRRFFYQYTKHSPSSATTKKKTHLLQGECHQPSTITSLYCMILSCPQLYLKNLSLPRQGACYVFETSLLLYSTVHTFGTVSNNTDKNTTEKALLHLVTPSHCKSPVQLETPSPFSDLLSSSHTALIIVLSFPISIKSQNHSCNLNKSLHSISKQTHFLTT